VSAAGEPQASRGPKGAAQRELEEADTETGASARSLNEAEQ
jgi:hypothetical protein